jgi:hypothetical protein
MNLEHWHMPVLPEPPSSSLDAWLCLSPCVAAVPGSQDKEGDDPSRVGAAVNPLLGNGGLSTGIAKVPGGALQPRCCCPCLPLHPLSQTRAWRLAVPHDTAALDCVLLRTPLCRCMLRLAACAC